MKKRFSLSFIFSLVLHSLFGFFLLWNRLFKPMDVAPILDTPPCSIPLEVTAIAQQSQAPISKPKRTQAIVQKRTQIKKDILPEKLRKENTEAIDKKSSVEKAPQEPKETPEETQDQVKEKIENADVQEQKKEKKIPDQAKKDIAKETKKKEEPKKNTLKKSNEIIEDVLPKEKPSGQKNTPAKKETPKKQTPKNPLQKVKKKTPPSAKSLDDLCEEAQNKENLSHETIDEVIENALVDLDEKDSQGGECETPITDENSLSTYGAGSIGPLALSAIDRVKKLLMQSWRVPALAKEIGGALVVVVHMTMNPDGTVRKAHVVADKSTTGHPAFQEAAQTALEAIEPYRAQPLPFPRESYSQWKEFDFRFKRG